MFFKNRLIIEIRNHNIKILYANSFNVTNCDTLKIPDGSIENYKILNMDVIYDLIDKYLIENKINATQVSFVLDGPDISVRFMEVPVMSNKSIMEYIEWDLNEFLPELGSNSYFDFEIIQKIKTEEKKVYKLFVVAVAKERIERLLELSKRLDLKLRCIDMASNCMARVFKNVYKIDKKISDFGIITIGKHTSSFIIIDSGKPFIERKVPFNISNVLTEITKDKEMDEVSALNYLQNVYDFEDVNQDEQLHNKVSSHFENVFLTYERVIQFYTNGKIKKSLDKIFILTDGMEFNNIDKYVEKYFSTDTEIINSVHRLMINTKFPSGSNFTQYINCLGILLRKE